MTAGFVADGFYVTLDIIPVAAQSFADVDDHVDFDGAIPAGEFSFVALGFSGGVAVRETDYGADEDAGAFEQRGRPFHGVWFNADGSDAVFCGKPATVFEFLVRHGGMQERVVDHFGQFFVRVFHNGVVDVGLHIFLNPKGIAF